MARIAWIEFPVRNRHSKLLLGVVYRSQRLHSFPNWLEQMESMLSDIVASWNGLIILTGDLNIDFCKTSDPKTNALCHY